MKYSLEELIEVVYRYYPRGIPNEDPKRSQTEENQRLVEARRRAGTNNEGWRAMLERLDAQFPQHSVQNRSLHLPAGGWDAAYSACIHLPAAPAEFHHYLGFLLSFLVPYYTIYSFRTVNDFERLEQMKALRAKLSRTVQVIVRNTMFVLPAGIVEPEFVEPPSPMEAYRNDISFDLSPDEQPYAAWIAHDIETSWGYERMPPETGCLIVPDVSTNARALGEATLFDCLFSDDHPWVKSSPPKPITRVEIAQNQLPEALIGVLSVLAAFYTMGLALAPPELQNAYFRVLSDGVLRKDELLQGLAKMRVLHESPATLRAINAAREFEALLHAWKGEGGPPEAMIAWARDFLAAMGKPLSSSLTGNEDR